MRIIDADVLIDKLPKEYLGSIVHAMINEAPTIEPTVKCVANVSLDERKVADLVYERLKPKRGENLNTKYADCDQFICSECEIELRDWTRVEVDEDDGEEYHYEYVFNFCPNCGAKIGEREGE